MTWLLWALLSALFAAATAILAKFGVAGVDSNLASAIRTSVIVVFTWAIAGVTYKPHAISQIHSRGWLFLVLSGLATGFRGFAISVLFNWGPHQRWRRSTNSVSFL